MSLPYPAGGSCYFKTVELQARNGQKNERVKRPILIRKSSQCLGLQWNNPFLLLVAKPLHSLAAWQAVVQLGS